MNRTIICNEGMMQKLEELFEEQLYNTIQEMAEKRITRAAINTRFVVELTELPGTGVTGDKSMALDIPLAMTMKIEKAEGPKEV